MTKTLTLQKSISAYKFEGIPLICASFIERFFSISSDKINLTVSTEPLPSSKKLMVWKGGFYRWGWCIPGWPQCGSMYLYAEDSLNKTFPDARTDGMDNPRELWMQVQQLQ